jgi:hypothetical protein
MTIDLDKDMDMDIDPPMVETLNGWQESGERL